MRATTPSSTSAVSAATPPPARMALRLFASGCKPLLRLRLGLLAQLDERVLHRFRPRRATRNVHVHGNDLVHAHPHVRVLAEGSAHARARAHRHDPLGLGHLFVEPADRLGHLTIDGARNDHHVGLTRGVAEEDARAVEVEPRTRCAHESFDRAARDAEGDVPEAVGSGQIEELLALDEQEGVLAGELVYRQRSAPSFHAYASPAPRMAMNTSISARTKMPDFPNATAHGYRKTVSMSKTTNRSAYT